MSLIYVYFRKGIIPTCHDYANMARQWTWRLAQKCIPVFFTQQTDTFNIVKWYFL